MGKHIVNIRGLESEMPAMQPAGQSSAEESLLPGITVAARGEWRATVILRHVQRLLLFPF